MDQLIEDLRAAVGLDSVLSETDELLVYECDGLPQHKHAPRAVVFPHSTEETAEAMKILARFGVPFTPRGAGTGLSGGALALNRGVVIELARMRRVLGIDAENRLIVVQTGVVNLQVSRAVAHLDLHYVPDPSSQPTCTIGGNIAENAGGIHCLKYGTTTDHIIGARVVLAGGEVVDLAGAETGAPGYDLLGTFVGSEGTFGIATEATLRLVPVPPAVRTLLAEFGEVNDASHAVSAIIAAGVMPAALEMMDQEIIRAVEASVFAAGLPPDAGAALLIELDGIEAGLNEEADRVKGICMAYGARSCRLARDETERKKLWAARKGAFGAIGRIAPDSMIQDAVVPRSRLPEVLDASYRIASKYKLRLANVFHAGDGNLHPLICFDSRSPEEVFRVREAGRELMETCVRAGGSITGEHGVGLDKRDYLPLIFSETDMDVMLQVRAAFDPLGLCNPGKIIPVLRGCGEARAVLGPRASRPPGLATPSLTEEQTPANSRFSPLQGDKPANGRRQFDPEKAFKNLIALVGESNVAWYRSDRSGPNHQIVSVAPSSIAEISELMRLASKEHWSLLPSGAETWLDLENSVNPINLIVSTRRLDRLIEHEPADLVATAEAGIPLSRFNGALSKNGQWLPLDPPDDGRATIGGVVATGTSGAQKYGYGPPRRYVIGMKVVLADGRVVRAGGRVVKNVAGYDLCKLFTGSQGTLGVIAELTFKLRPVAAEAATIVSRGMVSSLVSGARAVIINRLFPVAVEFLSQETAEQLGFTNGHKGEVLLTRFAGAREAVSYQTERALELLRSEGATNSRVSEENDAALWDTLAAFPPRFGGDLVWRASLRPAELPFFLEKLDRKSLWLASMAAGSVRVVDRECNDLNARSENLERLRTEAGLSGGSLVIEKDSIGISERIGRWGEIGPADLMRRIKQQLDVEEILPRLFG